MIYFSLIYTQLGIDILNIFSEVDILPQISDHDFLLHIKEDLSKSLYNIYKVKLL